MAAVAVGGCGAPEGLGCVKHIAECNGCGVERAGWGADPKGRHHPGSAVVGVRVLVPLCSLPSSK